MQTITKKKLHHFWTRFEKIRMHYLVMVIIILLGISLLALRHNNQTMAELRQAVYAADKQGGDVEGALRELREYVHSHMNTNVATGTNAVYPPIQLKYTYERLLASVQAEAKQKNAAIYTEAQAHCERLHPESYSGGPRVPCISNYVAERGVDVPTVPDSLYKFDFVSPRWSPDLAGWSIVLTILAAFTLALRIALPILLRSLKVL